MAGLAAARALQEAGCRLWFSKRIACQVDVSRHVK
jgi:hypothetical protein